MKTTLTKVLFTALLVSVAVSSRIQVTASEMEVDLCKEITRGNIEGIERAIKSNINVNKKYGPVDDRHPLLVSIQVDKPKIVQLLLDSKADVNKKDLNGATPLFSARSKKVAELLIQSNANVNAKDYYDYSVLDIMMRNDNQEIAQQLRIYGAVEQNKMLMKLEKKKRREDIYQLIDLTGIKIIKNSDIKKLKKGNARHLKTVKPHEKQKSYSQQIGGLNPLVFAMCQRRPEKVELLLENGTNPNLCNEYDGNFPLYTAVDFEDPEMVELLIKHKADVDQKNWHGATAFDKATALENSAIIQLLKSSIGESEQK